MKILADLIFSDLCVDAEIGQSWIKATPDSLEAEPLPSEYLAEAEKLYTALVARHHEVGKPNFRIVWDYDSMRVQRMQLADDKAVFICRRFQLCPARMTDLGMPKSVAQELTAEKLREGAIVFLGKAGAGKTTAAVTLCRERLHRYGGVCWTTENPIELNFAGRQGKGVCYQTESDTDEEMAAMIASIYRATPNIIFVGEARGGPTVREAAVAALSGHLVVLTLHAGDIESGITRLAEFYGGHGAYAVLADALKAVVHLELHHHAQLPTPPAPLLRNTGAPTGLPPRVLAVEPLFINNESIRSMLRDGAVHLLRNEIERQRRMFMAGGLR